MLTKPYYDTNADKHSGDASDNSAQNLTAKQFDSIYRKCIDIYSKKLTDYGTSWRLMRLPSITDQIFIKAQRIRTIEETGTCRVDEGIIPEYIGIVNYGIIALIQSDLKPGADISTENAVGQYTRQFKRATSLMYDKNHDYDEVWRQMRISSFTDIILTELRRIKQIEDHDGQTLISEGVDAGYMDIVNYGIFALIKLGLSDV